MEKSICALSARILLKIEPAAHQRNSRNSQIFPVKENFGRNSSIYH